MAIISCMFMNCHVCAKKNISFAVAKSHTLNLIQSTLFMSFVTKVFASLISVEIRKSLNLIRINHCY